ncbi:MAG: superoxide dismutase [candidate division Zixibacteria bacterium]|nr:superoxide dismutase [candidate division Zixibacteria bacterium]
MRLKTNVIITAVLALTLVALTAPRIYSHCEIPCGIYDDNARLKLMAEDIETIEKSMNEINRLSAEGDKNYNQLIRWVVNKENHAEKLTEIITGYFMSQRVKVPAEGDSKAQEKYVEQLTLLHKMIVEAMKATQTTDLEHVKSLRKLLKEFEKAYHGHTH